MPLSAASDRPQDLWPAHASRPHATPGIPRPARGAAAARDWVFARPARHDSRRNAARTAARREVRTWEVRTWEARRREARPHSAGRPAAPRPAAPRPAAPRTEAPSRGYTAGG